MNFDWRKSTVLVATLALLACTSVTLESTPSNVPGFHAGPVVPVGGGGEAPGLIPRILALAGGTSAPVIVIPAASSLANAGTSSVDMWQRHGATDVTLWNPSDASAADLPASLALIRRARVFWFGGGSQERIMVLLQSTEALKAIRAAHVHGAVVGGTSAGAAVLGDIMMIRGSPEGAIAPDRIPVAPGLGVLPDFVVDQHLLARGRIPRLLSVLPAYPHLKGLGLEERTAAIIHGDSIEIVGAGQAVLYQPIKSANADMPAPTTRPLWRIPEVKLSILLPGDRVLR